MSQKGKITEILVVAGLAAFAYYRYSKMTEAERQKIQNDIREIGEKVIKEFIPEGIKSFIPALNR